MNHEQPRCCDGGGGHRRVQGRGEVKFVTNNLTHTHHALVGELRGELRGERLFIRHYMRDAQPKHTHTLLKVFIQHEAGLAMLLDNLGHVGAAKLLVQCVVEGIVKHQQRRQCRHL